MSDSEPVVVGFPLTPSTESAPSVVDQAYLSAGEGEGEAEAEAEGVETGNGDLPVIVGMACRLPGDIRSPSDLWSTLISQKTGQGPVPSSRYNISGFYHPDKTRSGGIHVPGGYFINEDIRSFDPDFFGINNLEATYMDPQQRKILEVVYEALESSGTTLSKISGSNTGVYVGNFSVDYQPMQTRDPDYLHRYTSTGSGATIMSNRVSHVFNLHGPSFTLDTACSSSVYALHQALTSLRIGECDGAIVASANLMMSPELHIGAAKGGVLSPTGTCHTFDASADGYGRAEGVNAVYIKRLSAAIRDGDPIRGVIRGSAVNANGKTQGISLPSGDLQEVVMKKAYANAGLEPSGTDYVECHGTGTPVGDPIEVDAVGRCFSPRGVIPLRIGSVKTNVGHSEAASGLTSIIKVVGAFENNLIPPSAGIKKLNPKLVLKERNNSIPTQCESWPRALRRASINSFGYGGANAHVILEAVESYLSHSQRIGRFLHAPKLVLDQGSEEQLFVLPVSASSGSSLEARLESVKALLSRGQSTAELQNLAHTLTKGRDALSHRAYLLASPSSTEALNDPTPTPTSTRSTAHPLSFIFTGQGAQYAGMGKTLILKSTHFLSTIRALDSVLSSLPAPYATTWTIEHTLLDTSPSSPINQVTHSQPICTAVQIALIDLLRSWDIVPQKVVGHSSGEIAAAYAAGLLSASQAILVAYYRGYAVGQLTSKGGMMAAGLDASSAQDLISKQGLDGKVRVACVNSPESVTLSGSITGVEQLQKQLQSEGKFARKLETGGRAYHSHMMQEIGPLYEELLNSVFESGSEIDTAADVQWFSSVGFESDTEHLRVFDSASLIDMPAYWRENLEQPVQFSAALSSLAGSGKGKAGQQLIEIGPHAALKGPVQQIRKKLGLTAETLPYLSALDRKLDSALSMKHLAGSLFVAGHVLSWESVNDLPSSGLEIVHALAPYKWDYSAGLHWAEPRASVELRNRKHLRHELLGTLALTGNGIDYTWRNILKPSEMPWIKDHKLEAQVVFPAAGYLALAIEAVSRITGVKDMSLPEKEKVGFVFANVNISAALVIPDERDPASKDLELHTTMAARKISTANSSGTWFDFSISSWDKGQTAVHCTGGIRLDKDWTADEDGFTVSDASSFDKFPTPRAYAKWQDEGLNFGPSFQSLSGARVDGGRAKAEAITTTALEPAAAREVVQNEKYAVHPIAIDACFQAAILGDAKGHLASLKAYLPVFISGCRVRPVQITTDSGSGEEGEIHSRATETGFTTRRIDSTLRDRHGNLVVDMAGVRMSLYTGKSASPSASASAQAEPENNALDLYLQRQPTLRVNWKPDALRLSSSSETQIRAHIEAFVDAGLPDEFVDDASLGIIGALVDLAGHKVPRMRVLELGGDGLGYKAKQWLGLVDGGSAFSRCREWVAGGVDEDGHIDVEGEFEMLVLPGLASSKKQWRAAEKVLALLAEHGVVITRKSSEAIQALKNAGFDIIDVGKQVLYAVRPTPGPELQGRTVFVVLPNTPDTATTTLSSALSSFLPSSGLNPKTISLDQLDNTPLTSTDIVISLLETTTEFLPTISDKDMARLKSITDTVTDLLWLTGADMLGASPNPNLTLSSGLSRALMLEQPALRYSVLDLGSLKAIINNEEHIQRTVESIFQVLAAKFARDDCEFIQSNGLLHVSRFGPDQELNELFRRRLEPQSPIVKQALGAVPQAQLSIAKPGVTDSVHFKEIASTTESLPSGYVEISVKAVGLSSKDASVLKGRVETRNKSTASEFAGIVTAIGPDVHHLSVGDRAVAWAPNRFSLSERVPATCVQRLLDDEGFTVLPALLTVYGTALYALLDRARLRAGESVLVHDAEDGVGFATVSLAQMLGATVFATTSSEKKKEYLIKELGVEPSHIFVLDGSTSFILALQRATSNRGVDVILNTLAGDLLHESWTCLSDFGRFIEIGKRELLDAGKLDMSMFLRGASFSAFEITDLFWSEDPFVNKTWERLVVDVLRLYREHKLRVPAVDVFDVADIVKAYKAFEEKDRIGSSRVIVSLENQASRVPVIPALYSTTLSPTKNYLLIGCLGGLGRSLSRWMMARGARNFVFVGRSGTDNPSAKALVTRLTDAGATVTVVRGDVGKADDITAAVEACTKTGLPIGGVVQAAMGLHEALFTTMSNAAWHTGIDPKYQGTWNLHNALAAQNADAELDFFLLTSSVSGTVGTATESNYCAANGFLDSFAQWRRSRNKPGIAVGLGMISEVGYLHENPEIEALLLRKGIQPLNEDEFLQVVDFALVSEFARKKGERNGLGHILTGLEPAGVRELSAKGFDVSSHGVLIEPRAAILSASLQAEQEIRNSASSGADSANTSSSATAAPWFKSLSPSLQPTYSSECDSSSLPTATLSLLKKRFSSLILMPVDQINEGKSLAEFGVDSMIASEFRTWFWTAFKVDVPFLDIMSPRKSLGVLGEFVAAKVEGA